MLELCTSDEAFPKKQLLYGQARARNTGESDLPRRPIRAQQITSLNESRGVYCSYTEANGTRRKMERWWTVVIKKPRGSWGKEMLYTFLFPVPEDDAGMGIVLFQIFSGNKQRGLDKRRDIKVIRAADTRRIQCG